jgi:hypothetical protein
MEGKNYGLNVRWLESAASDLREPQYTGIRKHAYLEAMCSSQLRVFSLGLLHDGDVGVGVFPKV